MTSQKSFPKSFGTGLRSVLTPLDIVLIVSLFGFSLIGFALPVHHSEGGYVVIEMEGSELYRIALNVERTVKLYGKLGYMEIRIEDGKAKMVRSSCPLKLCISSGAIEIPGQMIVCVPNGIVARIEGKEGFDAVLR